MALSEVSRQARQLSSGTISHLIHRTNYEVIERAQQEFVAFVDRMDAMAGRPLYRRWQDAWDAFRQTNTAYEVMLG